MRSCCRCQCEMVEGFTVSALLQVDISHGTGIFTKNIGKPEVAICPKCGEISLYTKNLDKVEKCKHRDTL